VYLRPGPEGAGIDRLIPFPELPFNENYQEFRKEDDSIRNIGQLLGPFAFVEVWGDLMDIEPQNGVQNHSPKRLQANITAGKICGINQKFCFPLPIQGVGVFESVFLSDRLRIGQNINGGGVLAVQVRVLCDKHLHSSLTIVAKYDS
jgi:hypothetical protein